MSDYLKLIYRWQSNVVFLQNNLCLSDDLEIRGMTLGLAHDIPLGYKENLCKVWRKFIHKQLSYMAEEKTRNWKSQWGPHKGHDVIMALTFDSKMLRCLSPKSVMKYDVSRLKSIWVIVQQLSIDWTCQYDLDLWSFDPKTYTSRYLPIKSVGSKLFEVSCYIKV